VSVQGAAVTGWHVRAEVVHVPVRLLSSLFAQPHPLLTPPARSVEVRPSKKSGDTAYLLGSNPSGAAYYNGKAPAEHITKSSCALSACLSSPLSEVQRVGAPPGQDPAP
jgi:hypothetical protein